ncbi:MAG: type II toxin-antitoxin system RelE/ParE family toxin [Candidatus Competibacteraceae bacterium]
MFDIDWMPKALRQLRKIREQTIRAELVDAAETLRDFPNCPNVKALVNHRYGYRLRVGRYRILFDVYNVVNIIAIQEVKKRNERTY